MNNLFRSMSSKWIIDKNVNSRELLSDFTKVLMQEDSGFSFDKIVARAISQGRKDEGDYAEKGSIITIGVRLLQSCFYMLGYSKNLNSGGKLFVPTPMTINLLNISDRKEEANNYLVNLFCMQYPHPFNQTPESFNIFFGRLIVKLLTDARIKYKLYIDEIIWFLPFIRTINEDEYENLIVSILKFRELKYTEKLELFHSVTDFNNLFANVLHEINYYFLRLYKDCDVFNIIGDPKHNEGKLFRFLHSSTDSSSTFRNDAYKSRANHSGFIELTQLVKDSAIKLITAFSPFQTPTFIDGEEIFSKEDWIVNLYEIEPLKYLLCINNQIDRKSEVSKIVTEMVSASKYGSRDGKEFEYALKPFMKLFKETLNVEIISGAGNTDLLCTMDSIVDERTYNINVEAKTRSSALSGILASRISKHLRKVNSKFCIVVAPRFSKGVIEDIAGHSIVTVRSEDLGTYCLKECTYPGNEFADFSAVKDIIEKSLGTDITSNLRELTEARYGVVIN